ncbi:glycosyltransferase [Delftia lacustris]|uniref:glycosyltransferase n=1 Tax=Delftia lacustris TaxID=558537 RepID=UPI001FCB724E|nr:NACHT domain-containing protein [Delftia lacustris]BDE72822.1 hypothetical protein HQS1_39460 [Delftia lacustris]
MANSYVFFATAWSAVNGGINAFNLDLCQTIASIGQKIDIFLECDAAVDAEIPASVRIHRLPSKFENFGAKEISIISELITDLESVVWVGHDAITGGVALFTKNTCGGRAAIFHHMDYSNYYYLKQNDVAKKIKTQKHLLREADIVFGVGPRLFQNARHLRPSHLETYEITPGCPEVAHTNASKPFDYRIALCGRLHPSEDKVKNLTSAVKAAHGFLSRVENRRGSITLIGAQNSDINNSRLGIDSSVAINTIPYISSREAYFTELRDADIVLMPSVKEGFGLVAWEAACLGIPVILSRSSGVYDFLKEKGLADFVQSIEISGVPALDENKISQGLFEAVENIERLKANASKIEGALSTFTWKTTAERFLSLLEGRVESIALESQPPIEKKEPQRSGKARTLYLDKLTQSAGFERFEDLLSITARRRKLLIDKSESTDSSKGQRIKFEYWATYSPQASYFLYIHHNSNIKQTVKRFARLLASYKLEVPRNLFVIRRDPGDPNYMQKMISQEGIASFVHDYTFKAYLWEFGIDEEFKSPARAEAPLHYVDQAIAINGETVESTTARELILKKLQGKPEHNAHLITAAGGMGKTWLCRSISSQINSAQSEKILVVLIQAENLRNYVQEVGSAHVQVSSVFDLYQLHAQAQKVERIYDRGTFELAVIAGNIILIIDGLDELATVLQERFDLNKFLTSIVDLSTSLSSSHIVITTRDSLLIDTDASIEFGMARYELLGFNSSDWTSYAKRRFSAHPNSEHIVNRLNSTLSSSKLSSVGGRVVPFFVDVLCTMFDDETKIEAKPAFEFTEELTPYASNNDITDHIVHSVFRREIRRQTIDLDVDKLVSVISEVVSEQGDSFSIESLGHLLSLYYETRADDLLRKIVLNPFFQVTKDNIRLRYDFLQSYFRALFVIECIDGNSHSPEAQNAYSKTNSAESPEVAYLRKYFAGRQQYLDEQLHKLIPNIRAYVKNESEPKRIELGRRSISGLLKIYQEARAFTGARMSEKIIEWLPGIGAQSIDGLAIYGDFPALDFMGKTVFNSKFLDYKNFAKSKFSDSKFISCIFESCAGEKESGSTIHLAEFDAGCTLGDVSTLVSNAKASHSLEERTVETECLAFLRVFFKYGVAYDPKQTWLNFSNKVRGLRSKNVDKLIPEFLIIKSQKGADTHYALASDFVASARSFIDNNYIDRKMKDFLSAIK